MQTTTRPLEVGLDFIIHRTVMAAALLSALRRLSNGLGFRTFRLAILAEKRGVANDAINRALQLDWSIGYQNTILSQICGQERRTWKLERLLEIVKDKLGENVEPHVVLKEQNFRPSQSVTAGVLFPTLVTRLQKGCCP